MAGTLKQRMLEHWKQRMASTMETDGGGTLKLLTESALELMLTDVDGGSIITARRSFSLSSLLSTSCGSRLI